MRRGTFLLLVSLVMGGLAAWAANNWVQARLSANEAATDTARVVVAAMNIGYGTRVEPRHLRTIELPPDTVPENAFRQIEDVEGMVAMSAIIRGEMIVRDRFAQHESGSTLASLLSEGMRAVTVRVDDVVGVAGFLLPGNRVDVVAARSDGNRRVTTETVLRNIRVLAVDQTAATDRNDPIIVRAVTLELSPEQSEILVKSREEGRIQLTLRNPLAQDEEEEETVVEAPPPPAPRPVVAAPRAAPASSTVTVIRGLRVDTERPQN